MQLMSDMTIRKVQVMIAPPPKALLMHSAYPETWPDIVCKAVVLACPATRDEKAVFSVLSLEYSPFNPAKYMKRLTDEPEFHLATVATIKMIHGTHTL